MTGTPEHVRVNRDHWNDQAGDWVASGERSWRPDTEPSWGIWSIPESELGLLPQDMTGMDAIELGCGTAYVSAWMARRGARVVALDLSERQLATARRLAAEHDVALSLIHADAEHVPFGDQTFDFAVSEYGAALWTDPFIWIPEAFRLLRPGGELMFLTSSVLAMLCSPVDGSLPITERLERDYFSMHRFDWRDAVDEPGGVEFNLPVSRWIRLFGDTGFEIVAFDELRAPRPGPEIRFFVSADWAHRWPCEQVWRLRKAG
jgi:SAM-dependent methyltransferase